ncbi:MAG: hypothetical protein NTX50_16790 [Candidatus Sumerlaeota bacterium]|nr:hypothetical protein [Candidatus Sumerlaeota bacterium]
MLKRLLAVATLLLCVAPLRAQKPDPGVLTPDSAIVLLQFRDVTQMEQDWKKTGVYKLWSDPQMQKFTKPLRDKISGVLDKSDEDEKEKEPASAAAQEKKVLERLSALKWAEFKQLFPGGFAIALSDVKVLSGGAFCFDFTMMAKAGKSDRASYDRILEILYGKAPAKADRKTIDAGGVTIYQTRWEDKEGVEYASKAKDLDAATGERFKYRTIQLAMLEDWVLIGEGNVDTVVKMVQRHKGARKDTLADSARFRAAMKDAEKDAHILVYADLENTGVGLVKMLDSALEAAGGASDRDANAAPGGAGAKPFDTKVIHPEDLKALAISMAFGAEGMRSRTRLTLSPTPQGLGKLLNAFGKECAFKTAQFAPDDAMSYAASSFSISEFWHSLEALLRAGSPKIGAGIDMGLMTVKQQAGFDPIVEIVDQLGGEFGQITPRSASPGAADAGSQFIFVAQCKDGKKFKTVMDKIEKAIKGEMSVDQGERPESPFDKTKYLDYDIYSIKKPKDADAMGMAMTQALPAWAFTDTWVVVASTPDLLKDTLRRIGGKEARCFANTEAFKKARAMGKDSPLASINYSDLPEIMQAAMKQLQQASFMLTLASQGKIPSLFLDFSAMPESSVFKRTLGSSTSITIRETDAIVSTSVMPNP